MPSAILFKPFPGYRVLWWHPINRGVYVDALERFSFEDVGYVTLPNIGFNMSNISDLMMAI